MSEYTLTIDVDERDSETHREDILDAIAEVYDYGQGREWFTARFHDADE